APGDLTQDRAARSRETTCARGRKNWAPSVRARSPRGPDPAVVVRNAGVESHTGPRATAWARLSGWDQYRSGPSATTAPEACTVGAPDRAASAGSDPASRLG